MMASDLENDFEYLLLHSPLSAPGLTESLVRTYNGYAQSLVNLLFDAPEDPEKVLGDIFTDTIQKLDQYLLGTSFKLWFTKRAIKVCRKRLKPKARISLPWPAGKDSTSRRTNTSPSGPPDSNSLTLKTPPFNLFLPLVLFCAARFTLPELAEYFKSNDKNILTRLEKATRTLLDQVHPDWASLPLNPTPTREHREVRKAAIRSIQYDSNANPAIQAHLEACPRCRSFSTLTKPLVSSLRTFAGPENPSDAAAINGILMAIRSEKNSKIRPLLRLPYMEVLWVVLAAGMVLTIGWLFNQFNPLIEVQSAIQALETPVALAIVNNPPAQVLTTGTQAEAEAARIVPESSWDPQISPDGSRVVFASSIRRLVDGDTNEVNDIFVYNFENKQITRVSVDSAGQQANNASYEPAISANGRYVVFTSWANNLSPDDSLNCDFWGTVSSCPDVFLHDQVTGVTRLISKTPEGKPGNNFSQSPQISADGGTIAFWSAASDLGPEDQEMCTGDFNTHNCLDIFLYSPRTEQMERLRIGRRFRQNTTGNFELSISANGRWILFTLEGADLLAQELGISQKYEVYLYDRETGLYEPVNLAADGGPGDNSSYTASISDDGRWVAFSSRANNLVPGDTPGSIDVFLRDRQEGTVKRVSATFGGGETDGNSGTLGDPDLGWWYGESLRISGDGNWVIFASTASGIVRRQQSYACGLSPDCASNMFLYGRDSGQTVQINVSNVDFIPFASLSGEGQFAAFMAHSINCNPSDFCTDIYIFNRESGVVAQLGSYGILTGKEIPITSAALENKRTLHLHQYWTTSVAFSPAGDLLAAGARDGTVSLWSLPLEQRLDSVDGQIVAFSPDGALLAAGSDDGQIYLWRMPQGQLAGVLNNEQRARSLAFSPDGRYLAVGSSLRVRLWEMERGTVYQEFPFPGTVILDVAISPDGELLAAAADDETTWITSLTQPGYALRLGGHEDKVNAVDFSPNGLMLATAGNDNRANLWDLRRTPNGQLVATRRTTFLHGDWVSSVAFSPDSRLLATGSFDNTIALWDLEKGELFDLPFQQNQNQVLSVAWGPDGTTLAAGTVRGEVHFWKDLVFDK